MKPAEQAALVAWIWAQPAAEVPPGLRAASPRHLAAYREHAKALAVRALAAAYPRLQAWLGEADFSGLAWAYARAHPPTQGDMNRWGSELAVFLQGLPGMEAEPPLLAAFDWHLHRMEGAADELAPDAGLWQQLAASDPAQLRLRLSPLLRVFELPLSVSPLLQAGEGPWWLAWRAGWRPSWAPLSAPAAMLLQALMQEAHLAAALARVPQAAEQLGPLLHQGWQQGWLLAAASPAGETA
jgi:Putative DNA-binding domain